MTLLFSTGEASGDAYGAALLRAILSLGATPSRILALGGPHLRGAGATMIGDSTRWGAVGIVESLRMIPRAYRDSRPIVRAIKDGPPGVFVPIDFGYLNVQLARLAKERGWKVVYFAPPGSWRRDKQGADLPQITDAIITQFSWSADLLRAAGANAHWFGHPIKEMTRAFAGAGERLRLGVLPGSRLAEIGHNIAAIGPAARQLGHPAEIALASSASPTEVQALWTQAAGEAPVELTSGDTYGVLSRARTAVICSGTATLEAAILRCPMVVVYRGSRMMEIEYKIRKPKFEFISLPNILLGRSVVPELLQHDASPERIAELCADLWADSPARAAQLAAFEELDGVLGPSDGISKAAEVIASYLA